MDEVTCVTVGDVLDVPEGPGGFVYPVTVLPSCGETHGVWYCTTHLRVMRNNLERNEHDADNKRACVWAWSCRVHGLEQP